MKSRRKKLTKDQKSSDDSSEALRLTEEKLWYEHEKAWDDLLNAFKKKEQGYVQKCSQQAQKTILDLKNHYGDDFAEVWTKYLRGA